MGIPISTMGFGDSNAVWGSGIINIMHLHLRHSRCRDR